MATAAVLRDVAALADQHYQSSARAARTAAVQAQNWWRGVDGTDVAGWWAEQSAELVTILQTAQLGSAARGAAYTAEQAALQGAGAADATVAPLGFVVDPDLAGGVLWSPVGRALDLTNAGAPWVAARVRAQVDLLRLVSTLTQDAGRDATQAALVGTPGLAGWHRKLRTPSCARCAVMAGRFYRWSAGFARHDSCDCVHVPASEPDDDALSFDAEAAIKAGRVTGLSRADRRAIVDGADVSQVVNAKRGVYVANLYGQRVQATLQGTTRRAAAGRRLADQGGTVRVAGQRYAQARSPRLTPAECYRQADDRDHAVRLLRRNGYIT